MLFFAQKINCNLESPLLDPILSHYYPFDVFTICFSTYFDIISPSLPHLSPNIQVVSYLEYFKQKLFKH